MRGVDHRSRRTPNPQNAGQPDQVLGDHGIFEKQPYAKCRTYPISSDASVFPVARSGTLSRPRGTALIPKEERLTEDEIARRKLGPRGVPGGQDFAKMTPQQEKNIPKPGVFDGHTA